eukprot:3692230-Amphidinium_carterae.1
MGTHCDLRCGAQHKRLALSGVVLPDCCSDSRESMRCGGSYPAGELLHRQWCVQGFFPNYNCRLTKVACRKCRAQGPGLPRARFRAQQCTRSGGMLANKQVNSQELLTCTVELPESATKFGGKEP